jgi:type IV pilus assembly protein PilE
MRGDRHRHRCDGGFTLVELLVVMVIASILMMVAVPSYQQAVIKSRRADGRIALNDVAQRLERCYTQFGSYIADGCPIDDDYETDSPEGFYKVTVGIPDGAFIPGELGTYTLDAVAQGVQADDTDCTTLTLTNTGVRSAKDSGGTAAEHCW